MVVIATWSGHGKASGIETAERLGTVFTLSDGKVTHMVHYREPAEALKAAGLSE